MRQGWIRALLFGTAFLPAFSPQAAENWPGYEGRLHQSSSAVDLAPGSLSVAWSRRFNLLVPVNETRIWGDFGQAVGSRAVVG